MKIDKEIWAPLFLRFGLAMVFFLFGFQKLLVPSQTTAEIQLLLDIGIGPASAVNYYIGLIELVIAFSFLAGTYFNWTAPIAAFLATGIFTSLVYKYGITQDPTLNRDLGIIGAALALWLIGPGPWSFDAWLEKRREEKEKERVGIQ